MNHAKPPVPPPAGDGSIDLMGHHIPPSTQWAAVAGLVLLAGYFLLVPRVRHLFRRLAVSAGIAAACSAVYVGWHDHAHHASLVRSAAAPGADPVPRQLLYGWGFLTLAGTVALFAASGWWLGKRRRGRFAWATWPPFRRRPAGTVYLPPGTGRPPAGYEPGGPYGPPGLPPGFPPGFGSRR